jgi:hypothetical protein
MLMHRVKVNKRLQFSYKIVTNNINKKVPTSPKGKMGTCKPNIRKLLVLHFINFTQHGLVGRSAEPG